MKRIALAALLVVAPHVAISQQAVPEIRFDARADFLKLPPAIPLDWAAFGLVICSLVGIVFGTYPAYKAANLDPIESLRYE